MFNGIIFNQGQIKKLINKKKGCILFLKSNLKLSKKDLGVSISCDGVCLTLVSLQNNLLEFYLSKETIARSKFKKVKLNDYINLELPLKYGQKISGHICQGHVDTTAKVMNINIVEKTWVIKLRLLNNSLNKSLIDKASISINGVSLTISKVHKNYFEINVIPHTLKLTNLKNLKQNDIVNVEIDIFSKYIAKIKND